jgi:hypothetical protein
MSPIGTGIVAGCGDQVTVGQSPNPHAWVSEPAEALGRPRL